MSPVVSAKRAPLCAMRLRTAACPGLPALGARPQSPNTANENGVVAPAAIGLENDGEASVPSRSVVPPKTR